jgi:serine/threonine protein kinase/tetratricopeptide (TPR) repeat protein
VRPSILLQDTHEVAVILRSASVPRTKGWSPPTETCDHVPDFVPASDDTLILAPSQLDRDRISRTSGTVVGRYVISRQIGRGATSVVYAAIDPELERTVALKLVAGADGDRVAAEARALAAIEHPNIVTVYDVGSTADRTTFIAMELVRGQTLTAWREARPSLAARRRALADAGRGLLAAHQAGLIHRDFKPDNVMVSDAGRVVVLDFGLAAADRSAERTVPRGIPTNDDAATGIIVGTPAFMAPEQFEDGTTTAASDQFSFCLVAWELLTDERPFGSGPMLEIHARRRSGELSRAGARRLGGGLYRALARGLHPDPAERWPSLAPLIAALERPPLLRGPALFVAAGGLAVAATYYASTRPHERCVAPESNAARVWNDARRDSLLEQMRDPSPILRRAEDDARRLGAAWTEACETSAGGNAASFAAVQSCLEVRGAALAETVDAALGEAAPSSDVILGALTQLPDPHRCLASSPMGPPPPPLGQRDAVAELEQRLDRARRAWQLDRYDEANAQLDAIEPDIEAHGYLPQLAELRVLRALILEDTDGSAAVPALEDAYALAVEAGADDSIVRASSALAVRYSFLENRAALGLAWARVARAHLARLELDAGAELRLDQVEAITLVQSGRHDQALAAFRAAVERADRELEPDDPLRFNLHSNLAVAYAEEHRYVEAHAEFELARAGIEAHYGPNGLAVAHLLGNQASISLVLGEFDEMMILIERSLSIFEGELGLDHPVGVDPRARLGWAWMTTGDFQFARQFSEGTIDDTEQRYGPRHPEIGTAAWRAGWVFARGGDLDAGEAAARRSDAVLRDDAGERTPRSWRAVSLLGHLALARGLPQQALEYHREASRLVRADELADPAELAFVDVLHGIALVTSGDDAPGGYALAIPAARLLAESPQWDFLAPELAMVLEPEVPPRESAS